MGEVYIRQRRVNIGQKWSFSSQNPGSKHKVSFSEINIAKDWSGSFEVFRSEKEVALSLGQFIRSNGL